MSKVSGKDLECAVCGANYDVLYKCDRVVTCGKVNCADHSVTITPIDLKAKVMLAKVKHICAAHVEETKRANT